MTETNWFHDLTTDEAKEERATLAQRVIAVLGVVCLVVLLALAATWPTKAHAEAKANDPQECMVLADYGVTTRALTIAGVELPKKLEILGLMYQLSDDRVRELVKTVRQAADKSADSPGDFSGRVYQTCVGKAGDISDLLGPAS